MMRAFGCQQRVGVDITATTRSRTGVGTSPFTFANTGIMLNVGSEYARRLSRLRECTDGRIDDVVGSAATHDLLGTHASIVRQRFAQTTCVQSRVSRDLLLPASRQLAQCRRWCSEQIRVVAQVGVARCSLCRIRHHVANRRASRDAVTRSLRRLASTSCRMPPCTRRGRVRGQAAPRRQTRRRPARGVRRRRDRLAGRSSTARSRACSIRNTSGQVRRSEARGSRQSCSRRTLPSSFRRRTRCLPSESRAAGYRRRVWRAGGARGQTHSANTTASLMVDAVRIAPRSANARSMMARRCCTGSSLLDGVGHLAT